jgi:CRISPR-associated protein Csx14
MADASIPVDLYNPGQVFACLGLVELADVLLGDAEGAFDWSGSGARFHVRAAGPDSPVARALAFLDRAEAVALVVDGSPNLAAWKSAWGAAPRVGARDAGYPFPDPDSPATLVCALIAGEHEIRIEHWGDQTERDNVKFWAGAGGYPGAALARDALELIRGKLADAAGDPFALAAPMSSSFRLDWRRDYIPLDAGFSLNDHKATMSALGYPLVELLAAIGLSHARPLRLDRRDKLTYAYGVAGRDETTGSIWLRPSFLRAALGAAPLPFPMRRFRMFLGWPGQENQARAITTVTEESCS